MFQIELDAISKKLSYWEYEVFHSKVYMQRSTKKYIPPVQVTTYYLLYEAFNTQLKYDLNKGETNEV